MGSSGETGPAPVKAVFFAADAVNVEDALVTWTPPEAADEDLLLVTYDVYGRIEGGGEVLLASVDSTYQFAVVPAGYESYGVAVRVQNKASAIVYGCGVERTATFPYVAQNCI